MPFATAAWVQPVAGLQPSVVQTLLSLQSGPGPALQVPDWHVSEPLHALPSEQLVPFANTVCVHVPVVASHVSAVHGFPSSQ